jgi:hypothetical protein
MTISFVLRSVPKHKADTPSLSSHLKLSSLQHGTDNNDDLSITSIGHASSSSLQALKLLPSFVITSSTGTQQFKISEPFKWTLPPLVSSSYSIGIFHNLAVDFATF